MFMDAVATAMESNRFDQIVSVKGKPGKALLQKAAKSNPQLVRDFCRRHQPQHHQHRFLLDMPCLFLCFP